MRSTNDGRSCVSSRGSSYVGSRKEIKEKIVAEGTRLKKELKVANKELLRVSEEANRSREFYMSQIASLADERDGLNDKLSKQSREFKKKLSKVESDKRILEENHSKLEWEKNALENQSPNVDRLNVIVESLSNDLEEREMTIKSMREEIESTKSELAYLRSTWESERNNLVSTHGHILSEKDKLLSEKAKLLSDKEREVSDVQMEMGRLREVGDRTRRMFEEQLEEERGKRVNRDRVHESELAEKDEIIRRLRDIHTEELEVQRNISEGRAKSVREEGEKSLEALMASYEQKICGLKRVHENELSSLKEDLARVIKDNEEATAKHRREMEMRNVEYREYIQKSEVQLQTCIQEKDTERQQSVDKINSDHAEELAKNKCEVDNCRQEIERMRLEISKLELSLQASVEERNSVRTGLEDELRKCRQTRDSALKESDEKIKTLTVSLSDLQVELDNAYESVRSVQTEKSDLERILSEKDAVLRSQEVNVNGVAERVRHEYVDKMNAEIQRHRDELDGEKWRHMDEISKLQARMREMEYASKIAEKEVEARFAELSHKHSIDLRDFESRLREKDEEIRLKEVRLNVELERCVQECGAKIAIVEKRVSTSEEEVKAKTAACDEYRMALFELKDEFEHKANVWQKERSELEALYRRELDVVTSELNGYRNRVSDVERESVLRVAEEDARLRKAVEERVKELDSENMKLREEIKGNRQSFAAVMNEQTMKTRVDIAGEVSKVREEYELKLKDANGRIDSLLVEMDLLKRQHVTDLEEQSGLLHDKMDRSMSKLTDKYDKELDSERSIRKQIEADNTVLRDQLASVRVENGMIIYEKNVSARALDDVKSMYEKELDTERSRIKILEMELEKTREKSVDDLASQKSTIEGNIKSEVAKMTSEYEDVIKQLKERCRGLEIQIHESQVEFMSNLDKSTLQGSERERLLTATCEEKDREIDALKNRIDSIGHEFAAQLNEITASNKEKIKIASNEKESEYLDELRKKKLQYDALQEDFSKAQSLSSAEIMRMNGEIHRITRELNTRDIELEKYAGRVSEMEAEIVSYKEQIDRLSQKILIIESENIQTVERIKKERDMYHEVELNNSEGRYKSVVSEFENYKSRVSAEFECMTSKLKTVSDNLADRDTLVVQCKQKIDELTDTIAVKSRQLDKLKQQTQDLSSEHATALANVVKQKDERYKKEFNDFVKAKAAAASEMMRLTSELNITKKKLEESRAEVELLRSAYSQN